MTNHKVPAYSQHLDIINKEWENKACGIIALKTIIEYLTSLSPSTEKLIEIGLEKGAYLPGIGWKHKEIAEIAENFGLKGRNFNWAGLAKEEAFKKLKNFFPENPVIASIHKDFKKENGGHLILLTRMEDNQIFYNEPNAEKRDEVKKSISVQEFLNGWKKRIILIKR